MDINFIKKYPWLKAYDPYPEGEDDVYCALDDMPQGWRAAFGDIMCEELDTVIKRLGIENEFHIVQVKEKYGQLRFYYEPMLSEIEDIVRKYETISEHVCCFCGKVDVAMVTAGWVSPYCKDCATKIRLCSDEKYDEFMKESGHTPNEVVYRQYKPGQSGWDEIHQDISETVERIRKENAERIVEVSDEL